MILQNDIIGKKIILRSALEEDAEFILELRLNPRLNKYIKPTDPFLENQVRWIKEKQQQPGDYHMIIENLKREPLGIIALYNIDFANKTFEWGRWVISENAPFFVSVESLLLLYDFAFNKLKLNKAIFKIRILNKAHMRFQKKFGAKLLHSDTIFQFFMVDKSIFIQALNKYKRYHKLSLHTDIT